MMRRSARIVSCLIATMLAMQGTLVCQAACRQVETVMHETAGVIKSSPTPACHNQRDSQPHDPVSSTDASLCLGASPDPSCCCQISQSVDFPGDSVLSSTTRPSNGTYNLALPLAKASGFLAAKSQRSTRLHGDLSPPRTPLFISFHSLLI